MAAHLVSGSEIHRRNRILRILSLPEDRHNPPTLAVIHQLNAVDAALKRFRVVLRMPRFVSAEDVRDIAEALDLPRSLALEKSFLLKQSAGRRAPEIKRDRKRSQSRFPAGPEITS